jgi:hypothetical protein
LAKFYYAIVGVIDLPPLKEISPLRFECSGKELWIVCYEFFYMLPSSFVFGVVTPLHFTHLDDLAGSYSFCGIQNSDWSLAVR